MNGRKEAVIATSGRSEAHKKIQEGFMGQRMIVLPPDIASRTARNALTGTFHLTAIGFYPHATFHDRKRKKGSSQYILLYCVQGSGYIELDNKRYQLRANNFFIIPKGTPHHYHSSDTDPWSIYWAHFTGDHADVLYIRYTAGQEPEARPVPYEENRINLFNQILAVLENSFAESEMEISSLNFLHFLAQLIYQRELNPALHKQDPVNAAISFMKANLGRTFTIQQLASGQQLSVSHFSEIFRQNTGYPPIHYFNLLKVQQACQYLYFTNRSIKEICLELGFEDPYYFSRLFKKLMGLSPSLYRSMYKIM